MRLRRPKGIRRNNPGNIRANPANDWLGKTTGAGDEFESFDDPENGIRAIGKILHSYQRRGIVSLGQIIETWAPPNENITSSYIADVEQRTGWNLAYLPSRDNGDYLALVKAIIWHENGQQPYSDGFIAESLAIA